MSVLLAHPEMTPQRLDCLAGAGGFEPPNGGIKIRVSDRSGVQIAIDIYWTFGAPEKIRTPDPQIRSLRVVFDKPHYFFKPPPPCTISFQGVAPRLQTEWRNQN